MLARQGLCPASSSPTSQTHADCFHDESHNDFIASQVAEKIPVASDALYKKMSLARLSFQLWVFIFPYIDSQLELEKKAGFIYVEEGTMVSHSFPFHTYPSAIVTRAEHPPLSSSADGCKTRCLRDDGWATARLTGFLQRVRIHS